MFLEFLSTLAALRLLLALHRMFYFMLRVQYGPVLAKTNVDQCKLMEGQRANQDSSSVCDQNALNLTTVNKYK